MIYLQDTIDARLREVYEQAIADLRDVGRFALASKLRDALEGKSAGPQEPEY